MKFRTIGPLAVAVIFLAPAAGHASLTTYTQNFETLNASDPNALSNDGWSAYANVFNPAGTAFLNGYGYPAPNGNTAFSGIAIGWGGPRQGNQQLSVYSDYSNNTAQKAGDQIQSLVYQTQTIGAADVGTTWTFTFDAAQDPPPYTLVSPSTADAFILILDPANNYALTDMVTVDMTHISDSWSTYSVSLQLPAGSAGQLLEFGFENTATNYDSSGIVYDNLDFAAAVPEPSSLALMVAGLGMVGLMGRRRPR